MTSPLNSTFNIPEDLSAPPAANTSLAVQDDGAPAENVDKDFECAHGNIKTNIKDVSEALKSAILLAQSGDSPRAYEVVAKMLDSLVAANEKIVNIHKVKEEAKTAKAKNAPVGVAVVDGQTGDSIAFVGRADELLHLIAEKRKAKKLEMSTVVAAPAIKLKEEEPAVEAEVVEVEP